MIPAGRRGPLLLGGLFAQLAAEYRQTVRGMAQLGPVSPPATPEPGCVAAVPDRGPETTLDAGTGAAEVTGGTRQDLRQAAQRLWVGSDRAHPRNVEPCGPAGSGSLDP